MNTAGRLLDLYDRLMSRGRNDAPMVKVWAEVFDISADAPHLEDDVVTCLQATRSEIELLRSKLLAMGAPEEIMHPGMTRLRNITSPSYIHAGWSGLWEEASKPENRLTFSWAKWTFREEDEEDMHADELASLRSELDSLEDSLQKTEMAPYLREFIHRQIDAIRSALRIYRIRGVKPIEEALQKVAGAFIIEKARIDAEQAKASEPAKSVFAQAITAIEKTAKIADNLDKIRKAGEGAYTLAASVGPFLLNWGHNLLK